MSTNDALAEYQRACSAARATCLRDREAAKARMDKRVADADTEFTRTTTPAQAESDRLQFMLNAHRDVHTKHEANLRAASALAAPLSPGVPIWSSNDPTYVEWHRKWDEINADYALAAKELERVSAIAWRVRDPKREEAQSAHHIAQVAIDVAYGKACAAAHELYVRASLPRSMTVRAGVHSYEQFIAAGWTDAQLRAHGYMV